MRNAAWLHVRHGLTLAAGAHVSRPGLTPEKRKVACGLYLGKAAAQ